MNTNRIMVKGKGLRRVSNPFKYSIDSVLFVVDIIVIYHICRAIEKDSNYLLLSPLSH